MSRDPLSVEQAVAALGHLGHGVSTQDDGSHRATCPVCQGAGGLVVSQNGNGAHLACADCSSEEISGVLRAASHRPAAESPLGILQRELGLPGLVRVVKQGRRGEAYDLELADGSTVELGNARALHDQSHVIGELTGQADVVLDRRKPAEWTAIVRVLVAVAERRDDAVVGDAEEVRGWLAEFVRGSRCPTVDAGSGDDLAKLLKAGGPGAFRDAEGRLYVRLPAFVAWVNRVGGGTRVGQGELSKRLARLGFAGQQVAARHGQQVVKARYRVSPPGFEVDA